MKEKKKPKHTKEYYLKRKQFLTSCSDAFGVRGLYSIFIIDTLCIMAKWTYYKKAVQAREWSKKELDNSSEE